MKEKSEVEVDWQLVDDYWTEHLSKTCLNKLINLDHIHLKINK